MALCWGNPETAELGPRVSQVKLYTKSCVGGCERFLYSVCLLPGEVCSRQGFLGVPRASSGLGAEVLVLVIVNIVNLMVNKMGTPVRNYLDRIAAGLPREGLLPFS